MLRLRSAALTEIGKVRRRNEDRFLCEDALALYGVADGIGGLPAGAEAAQTAIDVIREQFRRAPAGAPPDLALVTQTTNAAVLALTPVLSPDAGLGTTLTFAHVVGSALDLAHVGDSRCYAWRDHRLEPLTRDHSVENEARLSGGRDPLFLLTDYNRQALTRCIGQPTPLAVDRLTRPLRAGDRYLFCTDGVSRVVTPSELEKFMASDGAPADTLRHLIALTLQRGGPDNATGVLLLVDEV